MTDKPTKLKRWLHACKPGERLELPATDREVDRLISIANSFATGRRYFLSIQRTESGLAFTRGEDRPPRTSTNFAALDLLAVGEHVDFDLPVEQHQRVRVAASVRSRGTTMLSCRKIGSVIRVTRVDASPDAPAATGRPRVDRWGLRDIEVGQTKRIEAPRSEHASIRAAAAVRNREPGVYLSCRADAAGITVTRCASREEMAQRTASALRAPRTVSSSKYDLHRLATQDSVTLDLPKSEHQRVRIAACGMASRKGWRLSCAAAPDGKSITVFRADTRQEAA